MIDLENKQKVWAYQLPLFKENYILTSDLDLLEFDMINGQFDIKPNQGNDGFDDEDSLVLYHSVNTAWAMWLRCNRLNQAEIDSLKAQLRELNDTVQHLKTESSGVHAALREQQRTNEDLLEKLFGVDAGEFVVVPKDRLYQWGHMANYAQEYGCPECFEARGYAHSLACEINEYLKPLNAAQENSHE